MTRWILSFAVGIACSGIAVLAHHSIAAVYDSSRKATVEGAVMRFQFTNPHPLLMIEVADAGGKAQEWVLEMDNRSELAAVGVTSRHVEAGRSGRRHAAASAARKRTDSTSPGSIGPRTASATSRSAAARGCAPRRGHGLTETASHVHARSHQDDRRRQLSGAPLDGRQPVASRRCATP